MSWLRPVAKNALKYGPHAQQVWKHAGRGLDRLSRRR